MIIMKRGVPDSDLIQVKELLIKRNFDIHQSTGANRTIIGVIGNTETLDEQELGALPGVLQVVRIAKEE